MIWLDGNGDRIAVMRNGKREWRGMRLIPSGKKILTVPVTRGYWLKKEAEEALALEADRRGWSRQERVE